MPVSTIETADRLIVFINKKTKTSRMKRRQQQQRVQEIDLLLHGRKLLHEEMRTGIKKKEKEHHLKNDGLYRYLAI